MGSGILSLFCLAALTAVTWLATPATAVGSSGIDSFVGTYRSTLSKSRARKEIDKNIESLVDDMAFYKRPFARSILKNRTPPCIELKISHGGGDVTIQCDVRSAASAKLNGGKRHFKPSGGDPVKVSYALKNGRLVQKFVSENGARTNTYTLSNGGKVLKLRVNLSSTKLPRPLTFSRTFKRK